MSLQSYVKARDRFELDLLAEGYGYPFPCGYCKARKRRYYDVPVIQADLEPCRHCDHNVNAVKDEKPVDRRDGVWIRENFTPALVPERPVEPWKPRVDCKYWTGCFGDDDKCTHKNHTIGSFGDNGYCEPKGCKDKTPIPEKEPAKGCGTCSKRETPSCVDLQRMAGVYTCLEWTNAEPVKSCGKCGTRCPYPSSDTRTTCELWTPRKDKS